MFIGNRTNASERQIHLTNYWYSDKFDEHKFDIETEKMSSKENKERNEWMKKLTWESKRRYNEDHGEWCANLSYLPEIFLHMSCNYNVSMDEEVWAAYQEHIQEEFDDESDYVKHIVKKDADTTTTTTGF